MIENARNIAARYYKTLSTLLSTQKSICILIIYHK